MMKHHATIILGLALAGTLSATSQTLTGEVTVQREIVPVEREATPLTMLPQISLPQLTSPELDYSSTAVKARVASMAAFAEPARRPDPLTTGLHKGYISLQAGPLFNAGLSAGYRIIDTRPTRLTTWLQYSGEVYRRSLIDNISYKPYWRDHSANIGLVLSQAIGTDKGRLDIDLNYAFDRTNGYCSDGRYWVNTNHGHFGAGWTRSTDALALDASVKYDFVSYNPIGLALLPKSTNQNDINIALGGRLSVAEKSWAGVDIDLEILSTGAHHVADAYNGEWNPAKASSTGVLGITPYYRLVSGNVTLSAGPRLDITFNGGKALHIAPMIKAGWTPASWLSLQAKVAGGEHLNRLIDLTGIARRTVPGLAYGTSHMPMTADIAATAWPYKSIWISIFGGWARANSWLMPSLPGESINAIQFESVDISGFHGGIKVGASWRSLAALTASWETAPSSRTHGYYPWRDRARHVVDIAVEIAPLKPLKIEAHWQLRACRKIITTRYADASNGGNGLLLETASVNLGNISDLGIKAIWNFSRQLNAWIAGENLLDRRNLLIDTTPNRGLTVMVGASYLF